MLRIAITSIVAIHMSATIMQATSTPSNPSNTPSLEAKANDLDGKAEFWTRWSFIFVSVTAASAVAYGICQGYLVKRQGQAAQTHAAIATEKERESVAALELVRTEAATESKRIEKDLTEAKLALGVQQERAAVAEKALKVVDTKTEGFRLAIAQANERAAKAQESLGLAEQHSAEANAKAEAFRLDIAKANESARQAEARAAEANLELARFKAPRTLSPSQQGMIAARLKPFGNVRVDVIIIGDGQEIIDVGNLIIAAMLQGGWNVHFVGKAVSGPNVSGVLVGTHLNSGQDISNAAGALIASLQDAGIATRPFVPQFDDTLPMAIVGEWDAKNVAPIRMLISAKP
jgi:hypothetical protein